MPIFTFLQGDVVPTRELLVAAYGLAVEYGRSLYAAPYLALSAESGADFVTAG